MAFSSFLDQAGDGVIGGWSIGVTKLICINSKGPMGSALLGGLVEKLGAVNVPVRQYGLSAYLLNEVSLNSGVMQDHVAEWVWRYSEPIRLGGINVLDRDSQMPKAFSDLERVRDDLDDIRSKQYRSLDELYRSCMAVFCKSVTYKDVDTDNDVFIDYPIDFDKYGDRGGELYDAYQDAFDEVKMIHLHRDFEGWINALAVQLFAKRSMKERFNFRLKSRVKHYYSYEKAVADLPGLHLDFHELFSIPIEDLAKRIGTFTDMPYERTDWRSTCYDLYGKSVHFDQAFRPVDDGQIYLDRFTRRYCAHYSSDPEKIGLKEKIVARLLFLWCYAKFRFRMIGFPGFAGTGAGKGA